jgi:hypothetical protein
VTPPAASSAARAAPLAPRRAPAPRPPRRVSGPLRAPAREGVRPGVADRGGLVLGVLGGLEALSSHRLLDRLIRGRLWIGLVAFALLGIVALQLGLLKLNSSIGVSLEKESSLQRENAALSIENSELAGGGRVESQAVRLGMRLTGVGGLQFHDSHARSDLPAAAAVLKAPLKAAEPRAEAEGTAAGEAESEASTQSAASPSNGEGGEASGEGASSGEASSSGESASGAPEASSTTRAEGEASEAPASAGEPSAEAGGGTAAPGG